MLPLPVWKKWKLLDQLPVLGFSQEVICDGTVRTREIIAWKRRAQNSSSHFPRYVIYYPRHGCFTSTKQNDIKVSIKNCKRLQTATAVSGSAAESLMCWHPLLHPFAMPNSPRPWLTLAARGRVSGKSGRVPTLLPSIPHTDSGSCASLCSQRSREPAESDCQLPAGRRSDMSISSTVSLPSSKRSSGLRGDLSTRK